MKELDSLKAAQKDLLRSVEEQKAKVLYIAV